jgi:hypothetical protein
MMSLTLFAAGLKTMAELSKTSQSGESERNAFERRTETRRQCTPVDRGNLAVRLA